MQCSRGRDLGSGGAAAGGPGDTDALQGLGGLFDLQRLDELIEKTRDSVVETRGISSDLEIDTGWPHSDQFVLTERIHLDPTDPNVLINEMRMEDPEALTEPFAVTTRYRRDRYGKLYEFQCSQNDRNPVDEDGNTQFE